MTKKFAPPSGGDSWTATRSLQVHVATGLWRRTQCQPASNAAVPSDRAGVDRKESCPVLPRAVRIVEASARGALTLGADRFTEQRLPNGPGNPFEQRL